MRKAVEPPGDALPDWKIFSEIGTRLGIKKKKYDSAEEIFNEMSTLTPTLTTGRRYAHYNTSTMTGRCKTLQNEFPEPIAQINTIDAGQMGLKDGDQVRVISRRGEVITPIRIGNVVPPGSLFMDFHFANANSNVLLGTFLDPVSKTPDYKVCAVKLEKCTA